MKKIALMLIFLLAFATCLTSYANDNSEPSKPMPMTAENNIPREKMAEFLYQKGDFKEVSLDEFTSNLDSDINGEEAIKLIGEAFNWKIDGIESTVFADVSKSCAPFVEYARLLGITSGVDGESFGVNFVNPKRAITWVLAEFNMDKEDVWNNTEKYSKEYGITMLEKENLNKGDMINIIYDTIKNESKVNEYTKTLGYEKEYVLIENGDYMIPAIITKPLEAENYPVVIGLHGTASNKDEAGGGYSMLAPKLAKAGIAFIRFDFIGTGDSKVDYIKYNLETAVSDANKVIEYAKEMPKANKEKIGLLGWSQGGTIALLTAGANKDVSTVVTWAGAVDLAKNMITEEGYMAAKKDGYSIMEFEWRTPLKLGLDWYEDVKATDVLAEFAKSDASVLAINGVEDDVVDKSNATKIVRASSNEKSKELLIEGAGHIFKIFSGDLTKYEELSSATVKWYEEEFELKASK